MDEYHSRSSRSTYKSEPKCRGGESEKDVIVSLVNKEHELIAMFSAERDQDTAVVCGRLDVVAEAHRGTHLCEAVIAPKETIGRSIGMGMAFGVATLHIP